MRLGILGGTFDPVHYGHLLLAECCREQARLDQVWFLPAAVPPHKQGQVLTDGPQRVEMLELAIGGHPALAVCRHEIERGGVNYTVDTLRRLAQEDSAREVFFLLGGDSLADLPTWRDPLEICRLATLVVVGRAEHSAEALDFGDLSGLLDPQQIQRIQNHRVSMPRIDLSSSDLRQRVANGQSIRYRTPRAVEKYIETQGLYRQPQPTTGQRPRGPH